MQSILRFNLLITITVLFVSACAQSKNDNDSMKEHESILTGKQVFMIMSRRSFKNNTLDKDLNESAVGGLYIPLQVGNDQYKLRFCSASFLNDREVITAAHCIPKAVREGKEDCSLIQFAHPKNNQLIHCESVKWAHKSYDKEDNNKWINVNDVRVDMVVLKMENQLQGVDPLELDNQASKPQDTFQFPRYTYKGPFTFSFTDNTCQVTGSNTNPHPFRKTNCGPIPSNSGAPVLSENNKIRGIMFGSSGLFVETYCLNKDAFGDYHWNESCPVPSTIH